MNRHPIKYFTLGTILAVNISVFFCTFFMQEKSVQGQHAGGGIIDTTKQPGKEAPRKNLFKDNMLEGEL